MSGRAYVQEGLCPGGLMSGRAYIRKEFWPHTINAAVIDDWSSIHLPVRLASDWATTYLKQKLCPEDDGSSFTELIRLTVLQLTIIHGHEVAEFNLHSITNEGRLNLDCTMYCLEALLADSQAIPLLRDKLSFL